MSKNNEDQTLKNQSDLPPANGKAHADGPAPGSNNAPGGTPGPDKKADPKDLTIEEHCQNMKIDKSVFMAVIQSEKWASGKRVSESVFKKAVADFNGGPMWGKKSSKEPEKKEEK
jgi:hypothetical protein